MGRAAGDRAGVLEAPDVVASSPSRRNAGLMRRLKPLSSRPSLPAAINRRTNVPNIRRRGDGGPESGGETMKTWGGALWGCIWKDRDLRRLSGQVFG